jgi:hypothetical protein
MINRRRLFTLLSVTAATGGVLAREGVAAQPYATATRGLPPLKITNVKVDLDESSRYINR